MMHRTSTVYVQGYWYIDLKKLRHGSQDKFFISSLIMQFGTNTGFIAITHFSFLDSPCYVPQDKGDWLNGRSLELEGCLNFNPKLPCKHSF